MVERHLPKVNVRGSNPLRSNVTPSLRGSLDEGVLLYPGSLRKAMSRKGKTVVAKQKRSIFDDLAARLRELLDDLDRLMNPQPTARPVRVPVPVPVQPQRPPRYDDPYR